ncbi:c-type cytochrome [Salmonella enterica]|nr:c-type cytochrome [Salmonella enterica]EDV7017188.1 c-type cytochrome [Salmonella enterica subsp. enterica]EEJ1860010.1 c-type cytochrome [Salmonella enterica subsp. enterica]EFU1661867.1 c-type cytochrome [Salmonella enterica]EFU9023581.1 c-type cytochrome [Salmonella enterica]
MKKYLFLPGIMIVCSITQSVAGDNITFPVTDKKGTKTGEVYTIPDDTLIIKNSNADSVLYGKRLLDETYRLLPEHVRAEMNCNSCHIAGGKKPEGLPYINTFNHYPSYNARAGREVSLAGRINGCFLRSMNGTPLPEDSPEMKAMTDYMKWLSQGTPADRKVMIKNAWPISQQLTASPERGKLLYGEQCSACHGLNGEGKKDASGKILFPPLWGDHSFNIGAGMARTYKAAAFIFKNMPMGINTRGVWGEGGTLTEQDAVDIAEYFTHMPRPDFPDKEKDWPEDKKPADARY